MAVVSKEELQKMIDEGQRVPEIAETLNVQPRYVYRLISKYGIDYLRQTKYSDKMLKQIQDLCNQGLTIEQVADEMHTTYNAISWAMRRYHIDKPEVKRPMPKLMQIRSQYFTEHKSVSEIATIWGTTEEEMLKYMSENKFFHKTTKKMISHEAGEEIPDSLFDDWFRTCPVCGRQYSIRDRSSYAYKLTHYSKKDGTKVKYFCSWTCIQKFRREHTKKRKEDIY